MTTMLPTAPTMVVNGADLPTSWRDNLLSLRVNRALGLVGRATVRFADVGYALSMTNIFQLGGDVAVSLHTGKSLMVGTVTGVSLEQRPNEVPMLSIIIDDDAYKLTRGTQIKTYLNVTYRDVIQQIVAGAGLSCQIGSASDSVQEYLMQNGGDLAYIEALCARLGFDWWIGGTSGRVFCAGPPGTASATVTLMLNDTLLEFGVQATGLAPDSVTVTGWDVQLQQNLTGTATTASGSNAVSDFVGAYVGSSSPLPSASVPATDPNPSDQNDAAVVAGAMYQEWRANSVVARGTSWVNADLQPGVTVQIDGAGPSSGTYRLSGVEHIYTRHGFHTRFVAGRSRPAGLVDTLGPARADAGLSVAGLVVGVVTDNNDPDKLGRVKVRYAGINAQVGSPWARIVNVGAGAKRGMVFMPEINDEVLVGFEHGDSRRPIVLGGLYSSKNTLPDWGVDESGIQARRVTSGAGHIFEFGDATDETKSHVLFKLANGTHFIRLGSDKLDIEVASGKPITIKAGSAKFEITASGDVNIQGNNVTIKADTALSLEGGTTAKVKGTESAELSGMQVSVKGSASGTIDGGGQLAVKGGMVAIN